MLYYQARTQGGSRGFGRTPIFGWVYILSMWIDSHSMMGLVRRTMAGDPQLLMYVTLQGIGSGWVSLYMWKRLGLDLGTAIFIDRRQPGPHHTRAHRATIEQRAWVQCDWPRPLQTYTRVSSYRCHGSDSPDVWLFFSKSSEQGTPRGLPFSD